MTVCLQGCVCHRHSHPRGHVFDPCSMHRLIPSNTVLHILPACRIVSATDARYQEIVPGLQDNGQAMLQSLAGAHLTLVQAPLC
jgi:hypothetical protein